MLVPQLPRGRDDQREAIGPVITAAADQPNTVLLADDHHAIAVVPDFVQPIVAGRRLVGFGWERKRIHPGHISLRARLTQLPKLVGLNAHRS